MNLCDWREVGPAVVAPLYARGEQHWRATLGWETADNWRSIERARTTKGLPGLLAIDRTGQVRGWTFFVLQDNVLHVGGLAAETPAATGALLDAVVALGDDSGAAGVSCFMFEEAPGVADAIGRRGFDTEPFIYLFRAIHAHDDRSDPPPSARAWRSEDVERAADLLRAAYPPDAATYLAPGHTPEAWRRYVRNLVEQTGLGTLNPAATRVLEKDVRQRTHAAPAPGPTLEAVVIVTALSRDTAHLAQVAVHPERRGHGLGRRLVEDACRLAAAQSFSRATLLVGASNAPARGLYASLGFTPGPRFLAARRPSRR